MYVGWQVRRRSAAERAGVKVGDLVLAINDVSTSNLTHQSMLDHINHQQLAIRLTLSRCAEIMRQSLLRQFHPLLLLYLYYYFSLSCGSRQDREPFEIRLCFVEGFQTSL